MGETIFQEYFKENTLIDRKMVTAEEGIDVIIPILNTNELFETNLYSFYREIPINRLLIGDGGCTDDSIDIVKKFPRVIIYNQKEFKTLGFRIQELIKEVSTDWFIYLHSDVFLPEGWYDEMVKHQNDYDWYECFRKITVLVEYDSHRQNIAKRPYSGSQMGKTEAFKNIKVDDDYLYRNEDIIFRELVKKQGFSYGRISDTFHYHQLMNKRGDTEPNFRDVSIEREPDKDWEIETYNMQARGIIKYSNPQKELVEAVNSSIALLLSHKSLNWSEFKQWVKETNPKWMRYIRKKNSWKQRIIQFAIKSYKRWYK